MASVEVEKLESLFNRPPVIPNYDRYITTEVPPVELFADCRPEARGERRFNLERCKDKVHNREISDMDIFTANLLFLAWMYRNGRIQP